MPARPTARRRRWAHPRGRARGWPRSGRRRSRSHSGACGPGRSGRPVWPGREHQNAAMAGCPQMVEDKLDAGVRGEPDRAGRRGERHADRDGRQGPNNRQPARRTGIDGQRHQPVHTLIRQALGELDLGGRVAAGVGEQHVAAVATQDAGAPTRTPGARSPRGCPDHPDEAGRADPERACDGVGAKSDPRRLGPHAGLGLGRDTLSPERIRHACRRQPGRCRHVAEGRAFASGRVVTTMLLIVSHRPGSRKWTQRRNPPSTAGLPNGCRPWGSWSRPASWRSPTSSRPVPTSGPRSSATTSGAGCTPGSTTTMCSTPG